VTEYNGQKAEVKNNMLCHTTAADKHKLQKLLQITSGSFPTDYFMYIIHYTYKKIIFFFWILIKQKTNRYTLYIGNSFDCL